MGRINFTMKDEDLHARARSAAALNGQHLYEFVTDAVRAAVEQFETERDRRQREEHERRWR